MRTVCTRNVSYEGGDANPKVSRTAMMRMIGYIM